MIIWDYCSTTSSGTSNEPTGGYDYGTNSNWLSDWIPRTKTIRLLSQAERRRILGESPKAKVGSIRWI